MAVNSKTTDLTKKMIKRTKALKMLFKMATVPTPLVLIVIRKL
jgi:hypothetical protein